MAWRRASCTGMYICRRPWPPDSLLFARAAPFHQFFDGQNRHAMQFGEAFDIVAAHHGAVRVHQLAQHGGRVQARHARQVDGAFRVAAALEHATGRGAQGEDVAGAHQVGGLGVRRDGGADGGNPVGGRHARRDAVARLDGDGERRTVAAAVVGRHGRQFQRADDVRRQAQADDAAAFADQQSHGFVREFLGRQDQVGFVFTVEIVEQDDGNAGAHGGQGGLDATFQVVGKQGIAVD